MNLPMKIKLTTFCLSFIMCVFFHSAAQALEADVNGQLSGWTTETRRQGHWENKTGVRYIPQLSVSQALTDESFIDAEISVNSFLVSRKNNDGKYVDIELYRAIV